MTGSDGDDNNDGDDEKADTEDDWTDSMISAGSAFAIVEVIFTLVRFREAGVRIGAKFGYRGKSSWSRLVQNLSQDA